MQAKWQVQFLRMMKYRDQSEVSAELFETLCAIFIPKSSLNEQSSTPPEKESSENYFWQTWECSACFLKCFIKPTNY